MISRVGNETCSLNIMAVISFRHQDKTLVSGHLHILVVI